MFSKNISGDITIKCISQTNVLPWDYNKYFICVNFITIGAQVAS